jgi:hypothetical protein
MIKAIFALILLYSFAATSADMELFENITGYYAGKCKGKPDLLMISLKNESLVLQWYPTGHRYDFPIDKVRKYFVEGSGSGQKTFRFHELVRFQISGSQFYDFQDKSLEGKRYIEAIEFKFANNILQRMRFQEREYPHSPVTVKIFNELVKHDLGRPPVFELLTNEDW